MSISRPFGRQVAVDLLELLGYQVVRRKGLTKRNVAGESFLIGADDASDVYQILDRSEECGGRALLPGLMTCGRFGRRLMVSYSGRRSLTFGSEHVRIPCDSQMMVQLPHVDWGSLNADLVQIEASETRGGDRLACGGC